MNQAEAKAKARGFVGAKTGVNADPDSVHLIESATGQRRWRAFYSAGHFFPKEAPAGATVDGGEYIVEIDDQNGEVSLIG